VFTDKTLLAIAEVRPSARPSERPSPVGRAQARQVRAECWRCVCGEDPEETSGEEAERLVPDEAAEAVPAETSEESWKEAKNSLRRT